MMAWQETEIGKLPNDWGVTSIEDISAVVTDGAHASPKFSPNGRMMCSVKDMKYDGFDFSDCKKISPEDFEKLKRQNCSPQKGDILISKDGEKCLDLIFVYSQDEEIVLLSSIAIVRLAEKNNPHFYRYFLLSPVGQSIMKKWFKSGTAIPRVVLKDFRNVPLPKVPLKEQINSSKVLRTLDKKIKNLQRQNQTLEKITQTLFKQWFVDFNFPDEDGKPYKDNGGEMLASELGEIPKGWKVVSLGEVIDINPIERIKKSEVIPYIDMKALSVSGMEISGYIERQFTSGSKFRNGDTLLARITPCLENGKTAHVNVLPDDKLAFGSTEFIVMRGNNTFGPEYVYSLARSPNFRKYAILNMTGSSGRKRVPNDMVEKYRLPISNDLLEKSFKKHVNPLFLKIKSNQRQIQTLTKTRDILLPKLMSGQIRIKD